jgi:hypothetical protein
MIFDFFIGSHGLKNGRHIQPPTYPAGFMMIVEGCRVFLCQIDKVFHSCSPIAWF